MIDDALRSGRIRILSIDGGGVYGLFAARVIEAICKAAGANSPAQIFDLIAGTSAGALLAALYATPNPDTGGPKYFAPVASGITKLHAPRIFGRANRRFTGYVAGPKYTDAGLRAAINATAGAAKLSEAIVDVLIPAYRLQDCKPFFFKTWDARDKASADFRLGDCARASASAPTFLPPAEVYSLDGLDGGHFWDGGLAANNPTACAVAAADRFRIREMIVVSVGTGSKAGGLNPKAAARWGVLRNVPRVISAALDGPNDVVDYQMRERFCANYQRPWYWRFDCELPDNMGGMDDSSRANLDRIDELAAAEMAKPRIDVRTLANLLNQK